jgi:hypothetical protein
MGDGPDTRKDAWSAFQRGDFAAALSAYLAVDAAGGLEPVDLSTAVELLIDRGRTDLAGELIDRSLDRWRAAGRAEPELGWRVQRFDLLAPSRSEPETRCRAAIQVLETLGGERDPDRWRRTLTDERRSALEAAFASPFDLLAAYEQESFAPEESGLPARARALIEELGLVHAPDPPVARAAERLLHALGEADSAYRVERARRDAVRRAEVVPIESPVDEEGLDLRGRSIVLAGGHPALRALIARDLTRAGAVEVSAIPSATEAVRSGRAVLAALTGADVAVLLVRQIAHSTSDQVRRAAKRAGIPVATAESAGIAGVRRALARALAERPPA